MTERGKPRGRPGRRGDTREQVLLAADELFLERGYLAVTVEDVAQRAGFTRGAVYSSFASKEDLMFAVKERRSLSEDATALAVVEEIRNAADPAAALGRSFASEVERALPWSRAELEFLASVSGRPEILDRIVDQQRLGRRRFAMFLDDVCAAAGLRRPDDREGFAMSVLALQRGLMFEALLDRELDVGGRFAAAFGHLLSAHAGPAVPDPRTRSNA